MPTGNAIIDRSIQAHGGEERFRRVAELDMTWTFRGLMFKLRRREGQLHDLTARLHTGAPRVEIGDYPAPGARATFTPARVTIERVAGPSSSLDEPRRAFDSLRTLAWWTELEMLYFAGYVLWNYAQLPFLLLQPGITLRDAGTTRVGGETWDKVEVTFPAGFPTHSTRQVLYIGPDGLLRRHDYAVGIMRNVARGARFVDAYQTVDGLTFPSQTTIKLGIRGETYAPWLTLGVVEMRDLVLVEAPVAAQAAVPFAAPAAAPEELAVSGA